MQTDVRVLAANKMWYSLKGRGTSGLHTTLTMPPGTTPPVGPSWISDSLRCLAIYIASSLQQRRYGMLRSSDRTCGTIEAPSGI